MFDFNNNGKLDFMEFAIGTGMFDPSSPLNQNNNTPYASDNISLPVPSNDHIIPNSKRDTVYWDDGSSFIGEIRYGVCWNGRGTVKYNSGAFYVGELKDGAQHGAGIYYFADGSSFKGEFLNGNCWDGNGTVKYNNGDMYVGEMKNGKPHGMGTYYWPDMSSFKGEFSNGRCWNGRGTIKYLNGNVYIGEIIDGKKQGYGTLNIPDLCTYEGLWKDDYSHGQGSMYWDDGGYFIGEFRYNEMWNGNAKIKGDNEFSVGKIKDGKWEYVENILLE
jgi:hypothetical protein